MKLGEDFYLEPDAVLAAQNLVGKVIYSRINDIEVAGIIVETEAYDGAADKACHAHANRRTKRTEVLFQTGGLAYVYTIYGMYQLLNIVFSAENDPKVVLIRALQPLIGLEAMQHRRGKAVFNPASGPGLLTKALGIGKEHSGISLLADQIWLEDHGHYYPELIASPRVNIGYAEEYKDKPWRFRVPASPYTSNPKKYGPEDIIYSGITQP